MEKELVIIGGPNGAGKTTFARPFLLQHKNYEFLNADEIARELGEDTSKGGNISAGKVYFERVKKLKEKGKSILIESTMSGLFLRRFLKEFHKNGYSIKIIYITLNSPETCIGRIQHRVINGGHHVPDEAVIRRFYRGRKLFWNEYRKLADNWHLLTNINNNGFEVIATGEKTVCLESNELLLDNFILTLEENA